MTDGLVYKGQKPRGYEEPLLCAGCRGLATHELKRIATGGYAGIVEWIPFCEGCANDSIHSRQWWSSRPLKEWEAFCRKRDTQAITKARKKMHRDQQAMDV